MEDMIGKSFTTTAVESGNYFDHFGIHPKLAVSLHGRNPEDIINVKLTIAEDQSKPKKEFPDYWAWFRSDDPSTPRMIFGAYFLLEMCFPYGIKIMEEEGVGKAYRVIIEQIK